MESILEGLLVFFLIFIAVIVAIAVGTFFALNKKLKATFSEQPLREKIAYLREQLKSLSGEKDAIREEVVQYINELRERNEITDEDVDGLQKRFDELVREIQDNQAKAKEARDDAMRRQEDLDKINHDIREQSGLKETLEKDVERLQKEKDKLEALSEGRSYAEEEERLNAVRDELERVQMDRAAQQTQLDICKDSLKGYQDRLEELKQDLEEHQRQWDDSEEERQKLKELQEDLADAQKELDATRDAAIDSKLTADKLSTDQMRLNNQIDRARQELADAQRALKEPLDELVTRMGEALEAKANALVGLNAQFNSVQSSLEKMKKELRELEARKNAEEGLSRAIASEDSKEGADDPRFESLRTLPDCLHVDKHGSQVLDEAEFINGLRSYLEKSNLSFSSRTLLAYHTGVKEILCKPLTSDH